MNRFLLKHKIFHPRQACLTSRSWIHTHQNPLIRNHERIFEITSNQTKIILKSIISSNIEIYPFLHELYSLNTIDFQFESPIIAIELLYLTKSRDIDLSSYHHIVIAIYRIFYSFLSKNEYILNNDEEIMIYCYGFQWFYRTLALKMRYFNGLQSLMSSVREYDMKITNLAKILNLFSSYVFVNEEYEVIVDAILSLIRIKHQKSSKLTNYEINLLLSNICDINFNSTKKLELLRELECLLTCCSNIMLNDEILCNIGRVIFKLNCQVLKSHKSLNNDQKNSVLTSFTSLLIDLIVESNAESMFTLYGISSLCVGLQNSFRNHENHKKLLKFINYQTLSVLNHKNVHRIDVTTLTNYFIGLHSVTGEMTDEQDYLMLLTEIMAREIQPSSLSQQSSTSLTHSDAKSSKMRGNINKISLSRFSVTIICSSLQYLSHNIRFLRSKLIQTLCIYLSLVCESEYLYPSDFTLIFRGFSHLSGENVEEKAFFEVISSYLRESPKIVLLGSNIGEICKSLQSLHASSIQRSDLMHHLMTRLIPLHKLDEIMCRYDDIHRERSNDENDRNIDRNDYKEVSSSSLSPQIFTSYQQDIMKYSINFISVEFIRLSPLDVIYASSLTKSLDLHSSIGIAYIKRLSQYMDLSFNVNYFNIKFISLLDITLFTCVLSYIDNQPWSHEESFLWKILRYIRFYHRYQKNHVMTSHYSHNKLIEIIKNDSKQLQNMFSSFISRILLNLQHFHGVSRVQHEYIETLTDILRNLPILVKFTSFKEVFDASLCLKTIISLKYSDNRENKHYCSLLHVLVSFLPENLTSLSMIDCLTSSSVNISNRNKQKLELFNKFTEVDENLKNHVNANEMVIALLQNLQYYDSRTRKSCELSYIRKINRYIVDILDYLDRNSDISDINDNMVKELDLEFIIELIHSLQGFEGVIHEEVAYIQSINTVITRYLNRDKLNRMFVNDISKIIQGIHNLKGFLSTSPVHGIYSPLERVPNEIIQSLYENITNIMKIHCLPLQREELHLLISSEAAVAEIFLMFYNFTGETTQELNFLAIFNELLLNLIPDALNSCLKSQVMRFIDFNDERISSAVNDSELILLTGKSIAKSIFGLQNMNFQLIPCLNVLDTLTRYIIISKSHHPNFSRLVLHSFDINCIFYGLHAIRGVNSIEMKFLRCVFIIVTIRTQKKITYVNRSFITRVLYGIENLLPERRVMESSYGHLSEDVKDIREDISKGISEEGSEAMSDDLKDIREEVRENMSKGISKDLKDISEDISRGISEDLKDIREDMSKGISEEIRGISEDITEDMIEDINEEVSDNDHIDGDKRSNTLINDEDAYLLYDKDKQVDHSRQSTINNNDDYDDNDDNDYDGFPLPERESILKLVCILLQYKFGKCIELNKLQFIQSCVSMKNFTGTSMHERIILLHVLELFAYRNVIYVLNAKDLFNILYGLRNLTMSSIDEEDFVNAVIERILISLPEEICYKNHSNSTNRDSNHTMRSDGVRGSLNDEVVTVLKDVSNSDVTVSNNSDDRSILNDHIADILSNYDNVYINDDGKMTANRKITPKSNRSFSKSSSSSRSVNVDTIIQEIYQHRPQSLGGDLKVDSDITTSEFTTKFTLSPCVMSKIAYLVKDIDLETVGFQRLLSLYTSFIDNSSQVVFSHRDVVYICRGLVNFNKEHEVELRYLSSLTRHITYSVNYYDNRLNMIDSTVVKEKLTQRQLQRIRHGITRIQLTTSEERAFMTSLNQYLRLFNDDSL